MVAVILVLLAVTICDSLASQCPKSTAVESLDLTKLSGKWYEHGSFGTLFIHGLDRCQSSTFTVGSDGITLTMANDRVANLLSTHIKSNWTAVADSTTPTGNLQLEIKLPLLGTVKVPLKVLATDYDNYVLFYVCQSFAVFKFNAGFILTRKRTYDSEAIETIYKSFEDALKNNGLSISKFSLSNQKNCKDDSSSSSSSSSSSNSDDSTSTTSSSTGTSTDTSADSTTTGTSSDAASTTESTETPSTTETDSTSDSSTAASTTSS